VRSAFPRASVEGDPAVAPLLAPFRQTR
jgi:hypothetical protein